MFALHLWNPTDRPSIDLRRSDADKGAGPLAPLLVRSRELALDVRPLGFASAEPAVDIRRTAEAKQTALLLLGAHKPLLLEGQLSGIVHDVVAESHCPVAVLVDRGLKTISRVLVAYAGGPEDRAALELARRIARDPKTHLTLFQVVSPGGARRPGKGRSQIADAMQVRGGHQDAGALLGGGSTPVDQILAEPSAGSGVVQVRVVEHASPPDAVLAESRSGYDLIVLGMHARWGIGAGMISLRRRRVLAEAPVSILAVHPPLGAAIPEVVSPPDVGLPTESTSG